MSRSPRTAFSLSCLLLAALLPAQSPAGSWQGDIDAPGAKLHVLIEFVQGAAGAPNGGWSGHVDIPQQGAKALPLTAIKLDGAVMTFQIANLQGEPTFTGKLDASCANLAGKFEQAGMTMPFALARPGAVAAKDRQALAGFDTWLDTVRVAWHVPGCAVAVVKEDGTVETFASGARDVDGAKPVTADTLFAIGSSTKAFTTFVLATLVESGAIDWDQPVRSYLPEFKLMDANASEHFTPRDLVTHRSGLPRHDLLWYGADYARGDLVRRLRYLAFNKEPRTEFQYNNLMFLTAGYLAERVTGKTWEALVKERVFAPLGMQRSNLSVLDSQHDADHAEPYRRDDEVLQHVPFRNVSAMGPAGSINSSVREMSEWVKLHLGDGRHGDQQVVQAASLRELHQPRMPFAAGPEVAEIVNVGYALGWFVDVYRGHRRIHHGGNIDGFSALVAFLPDAHVGFVVLTNLDSTPLPDLVVRQLCDRLTGLEPKDWSAEMLVREAQQRAKAPAAQQNLQLERHLGTQPSHPLADYVGEYEHPGYGLALVRQRGDALELSLHGITAPLEHWHYDVFRCGKNPDDPALSELSVQFAMDLNGDLASLHCALEPAVEPVVFARLPDAQLRDPVFLRRLEGEFELGSSRTATFAVHGEVLTLTVPGQPTYTLVPTHRLAFDVKELAGYHTRFELDGAGAVSSVRFIQPDGVHVCKPKGAKAK